MLRNAARVLTTLEFQLQQPEALHQPQDDAAPRRDDASSNSRASARASAGASSATASGDAAAGDAAAGDAADDDDASSSSDDDDDDDSSDESSSDDDAMWSSEDPDAREAALVVAYPDAPRAELRRFAAARPASSDEAKRFYASYLDWRARKGTSEQLERHAADVEGDARRKFIAPGGVTAKGDRVVLVEGARFDPSLKPAAYVHRRRHLGETRHPAAASRPRTIHVVAPRGGVASSDDPRGTPRRRRVLGRST